MRTLAPKLLALLILVFVPKTSAETHGENNPFFDLKTAFDCYQNLAGVSVAEFSDFTKRLEALDAIAQKETAESYRLQVKKNLDAYLKNMHRETKFGLLAKLKIAKAGFAALSTPEVYLPKKLQLTNLPSYSVIPPDFQKITHQSLVEENYCKLALEELKKNPQAFDQALTQEVEARSEAFLSGDEKSRKSFQDSLFWYPHKNQASLPENSAYNNYSMAEDMVYLPVPPESPEEMKYWKVEGNYTKKFITQYYFGSIPAHRNPHKLNPAEIRAIQFATSSEITLNKILESGKISPESKIRLDMLNSALNKVPNYVGPSNGGEYLTEEEEAKYGVGKTISHSGITLGQDVTSNENHRFILYSKTGKNVSGYATTSPKERFVLFPPKTKFKIVSQKDISVSLQKRTEYVMVETP